MSQTAYALPSSEDLQFTMMDAESGNAVPISVTADAIRKLAETGTPLEVFENYRTTLEEIASTKFDNLDAPDGLVIEDVDLVGG
jgi:hypothetical protein